ncbi:hypothetical protein GC163_08730 [bacterium]|nr:hypothetical protein [bacterium]
MKRHHQPASNPYRGVSAVEMAIALPVLISLVLGAVDFARAYTTRMALANAIRVGAEQGATHRLTELTSASWESRIQSAILEELQDTPQLQLSQLSVDIDSSVDGDDRLQIVVSAQVPFQTIVDWPGIPHLVPVSHSISMERYR